MANDNQIAVKKRLVYAEDLFAPVDFKVFIGGRSGGKTMAMYEEIFRQRVEMAPTIDAAPVVHGHWEKSIDELGIDRGWVCSCCKSSVYQMTYEPYEYCPHCGARMDQEVEEE